MVSTILGTTHSILHIGATPDVITTHIGDIITIVIIMVTTITIMAIILIMVVAHIIQNQIGAIILVVMKMNVAV
jgi:hypothetical protein